MAKKTTIEMIGGYLFILGVIIAIIGGLSGGYTNVWVPLLAIFGFIVGIINITDKEIDGYLIAVIALILLGSVTGNVLQDLWPPITYMLEYIALFAAFSGICPALKKIYEIAASK
ncbi:hypothetical protein J7J26_01010 [Candidatus Micrarchaeota archaeon]|nr:hypothetical protein [Candidatus Micrarchaeota archaeon]